MDKEKIVLKRLKDTTQMGPSVAEFEKKYLKYFQKSMA